MIPLRRLGGPQAAICDAPARMRVEAEDGRVRASQSPFAFDHMRFDIEWLADIGTTVTQSISDIYTAAQTLAASAGPLPISSTEPWVESDDAYAKRLQPALAEAVKDVPMMYWESLDFYGRRFGLPRARLVPADAAMREETL